MVVTTMPYGHSLRFKDAYAAHREPCQSFRMHGSAPHSIDHIFFPTFLGAGHRAAECVGVMRLLPDDEQTEVRRTGLPNARHASDHLMIAGVFSLP